MFIAVAHGGIAVTIYALLDAWKAGGGEWRFPHEIAAGSWMRVAQPYGAVAAVVPLFLLACQRYGEHPGRLVNASTSRRGE